MWNVTLEHTASHFIVVGKTRPGNPFLNAQLYDAGMVVASREFGRKYRAYRVLHPGPVVCESITLVRSPTAACSLVVEKRVHSNVHV